MKTKVFLNLFLFLLMTVPLAGEDHSAEAVPDSTEAEIDQAENVAYDKVIAYYLHMNRRCMTCEKLEAYSEEAVKNGFPELLNDSKLIWKVLNFEKEDNEHYAKDYQLFSQSVILSKIRDGKEVEWKNLDKIWKLVGNKEKFIDYVQTEVADFMNPKEEE